jgi:hypothetical protein
MRRIGTLVLSLATFLFLAACGSGSGPRSGSLQVERDTVGDTVVVRTLSGSAWGSDAHLAAEMSIGELDGDLEYLLGDVSGLAVGSDGTVYVIDGQARELRAYDAEGRYQRTLAGPGEGPGELNDPSGGGIAVLSDGRVVVRDPGNARLQVFSADGSESWEWPVVRGGFVLSTPLWQDREDNVYLFVILNTEADFGDWETGLARIGPDGIPGDTIPDPDTGFEAPTVEARNENSATMYRVPWAPGESSAFHPGGYHVHGISNRYAINFHKPDGVLQVQRNAEPVPVQSGERALRERRIQRNMRRLEPGWDWNGPGIPENKAPFSEILVTRDGRVWVQVPQPAVEEENPDHDPREEGSEPTRWREPLAFDVFGDDGTFFGRVHMPEGFSAYPMVIDGDHVWGVVEDDLGVQRVVRFAVTLDAPAS